MLKNECLHLISWSFVPFGVRRNEFEFEGTRVITGSGEKALAAEAADVLEEALVRKCAGLPAELDLSSSHFTAVERSVAEFFAECGDSLLLRHVVRDPDVKHSAVIAKLVELARAAPPDSTD